MWLTSHLGMGYYDRLTEIIVSPGAYKLSESDGVIPGEPQHRGTVVPARDAVLKRVSRDRQLVATG